MKQIWATTVAVWFLVVSALVLIPSYRLVFGSAGGNFPAPPQPPQLVASDPKEVRDLQVSLFTQQVALYNHHVTAHRASLLATYDQAVTKTLQPLLDKFLMGLLAYVFAKTSAQVVDNAIRLKNGQPPHRISLWD